jgi:hypothetical protein
MQRANKLTEISPHNHLENDGRAISCQPDPQPCVPPRAGGPDVGGAGIDNPLPSVVALSDLFALFIALAFVLTVALRFIFKIHFLDISSTCTHLAVDKHLWLHHPARIAIGSLFPATFFELVYLSVKCLIFFL